MPHFFLLFFFLAQTPLLAVDRVETREREGDVTYIRGPPAGIEPGSAAFMACALTTRPPTRQEMPHF